MLVDGIKLEALIDRFVNGKKAERNREILKLYYLKGCTYEEIEEVVGVSAVHVGRIVHKYGDPILLMMEKG